MQKLPKKSDEKSDEHSDQRMIHSYKLRLNSRLGEKLSYKLRLNEPRSQRFVENLSNGIDEVLYGLLETGHCKVHTY